MSLIGDAQEFLYYQKPQGTNTQFPPRGGVRNVSASYITGRKMPSRPEQDVSQQYTITGRKMPSRPEQDVSQQYTTLKEAREGERAAGILNTPALTSPLNKMIQEPSDVEQARGYLGMAQIGVKALEGITKISDATLGTDLAKSAFGSALKNVGGGLGAVNAGLSAYNIAQGRGTAKDYAMLGKTSLEAASKVAGKYGGTMISSALGLAGKLAGAAGSAYNITRGKGTPGNYVSAGGAISSAIGSATGSTLASAIGTAVSNYAAPAMLAREGLGALLRSIDHPVTRIQGELMQEPTFEGLAGAAAKKLYKGVFNPGARLEEFIDRVHRGFDPVGGILTGRIFDRRAITDILSGGANIIADALGIKKDDKDTLAGIFSGGASLILNPNKKTAKRVGAAVLTGGLSEVFCFAEGTPITMADGTTKPVEQIDLFDVCEGGGMVNGKGVVIAEDIYDYEGVMVTGGHAVYEDNKWIRVKDSEKSILVALEEPIKVYIVNNEEHVLIINDIIFADYGEVTDSENMTADERLAYLNDNCSF